MNFTCSMTKEHHAELLALTSQLELIQRELISVENTIHNARDEMDEAAGTIEDQKHSLRSVLGGCSITITPPIKEKAR